MNLEKTTVEEAQYARLKSEAVGSFNNSSDSGSGRIPANEGRNFSSWALMSKVKSIPVFKCSDKSKGKMEICNSHQLTERAFDLVKQVAEGFQNGVPPERADEGFGGTYFVSKTQNTKIAIFKPCDEEPLAPCNPKGFVGRSLGDPGLKPTVRVGEAALREVAAYLLDKGQFAKVPTTLLMRASHPVFNYVPQLDSSQSLGLKRASEGEGSSLLPLKLGSIQEFVPHICDTSEMGTSRFTTRDVQRIAILDIRLYNTDRHAGNILVRRVDASQSMEPFKETGYELIPIDHGFCLPEGLEPPYFEWQHWPQARMPLGEQELRYIEEIDIEGDKRRLLAELPVLREESLRTMEVSTTLLKKCTAAGLSLSEIAEIMTRPLVGLDQEKSDLEKLCLEAKEEIMRRQEITYISSDYDSDLESNEATPWLIDELQFLIDDLSLIEVGSSSSEESAEKVIDQGLVEESLEQLSCYLNESVNVSVGFRHAHRSLSLALPASLCPRGLKRGYVGQRTRRSPRSPDGSPKRDTKVTYPPLVSGSAPGSSEEIFGHMTSEEWKSFMDILCEKIDDGLKKGKWVSCRVAKQRSLSVNLGVSCPGF